MRVETLRELDADDPKLEIPWGSPHDSRLRYFDLLRAPGKIDELPECRRFPALAGFLRKVNRKGCPLRSAKCDVWVTTRLTEDERSDFPVPVKVGGYIDLVFASVRLSSRLEPHILLGKNLESALRDFRVPAQAEIAVRRCLFHSRERWGFYVTLFVHAYGATRPEAKQEWNRAIDRLGDVFLKVGANLPG